MSKQEQIERAVIGLEGKWPSDDKDHCCLFMFKANETYRAGPKDGWVSVGERMEMSPDRWVFVCAYPEFMGVRNRMENKHSFFEATERADSFESTQSKIEKETIDAAVQEFINHYECPKSAEQYIGICKRLYDSGMLKLPRIEQ